MAISQTALTEWTEVNRVKVRLSKKGTGKPVLVLHDTEGWDEWPAFLEELAKNHEVWYPEHPGFGKSELDDKMDSVDDLSYYYLDFMEAFKLQEVTLIGLGFGGWVAAELAVKNDRQIEKIVLVNPFGIRVSAADVPDYKDTLVREWEDKIALEWHDPIKAKSYYPDPKELDEERLEKFLQNQEAAIHFTWSPYLHNPKLLHRLHRIHSEVVVIWGESDGVVNMECGKAYADRTNGKFILMEKAGHFPYYEQPEAFVRHVNKEVFSR